MFSLSTPSADTAGQKWQTHLFSWFPDRYWSQGGNSFYPPQTSSASAHNTVHYNNKPTSATASLLLLSNQLHPVEGQAVIRDVTAYSVLWKWNGITSFEPWLALCHWHNNSLKVPPGFLLFLCSLTTHWQFHLHIELSHLTHAAFKKE